MCTIIKCRINGGGYLISNMAGFDNIKTVFIDLDDTIWDFTANSKVAMRKVYAQYGLESQCPYERFIECYLRHNAELWTLYHHGKIPKEFLISERFRVAFDECGIEIKDKDIPMRFNNDYLETIVLCDKVVDGAHHLLEHLHKRGPVYVLSNGFENLQYRKLRSGKLDKYIDRLILSDDINVTKPDRRLFDYALDAVGGEASTTVMIGDNYDADILGAKNAGWQTIFFDRTGSVANPEAADLTVVSLKEIERYL